MADTGADYELSFNKEGKQIVTGTPLLKGTEHYPKLFCETIVSLWQAHVKNRGAKRAFQEELASSAWSVMNTSPNRVARPRL